MHLLFEMLYHWFWWESKWSTLHHLSTLPYIMVDNIGHDIIPPMVRKSKLESVLQQPLQDGSLPDVDHHDVPFPSFLKKIKRPTQVAIYPHAVDI
ncbi:hypothetical protein E2C01_026008 [Portunus trituberculatus]|uniref:Uncharacterized protein n=1 Tax=Portunus trituberculatus TaxID=210409 RepID=A0A5B7EI04_PORTR|nr:hypothetical protein [Portunus trituberculatus]